MERRIYGVVIGILAIAMVGCDNSDKQCEFSEGVIEYEVSFPFDQDDMLINLYPKKMMMSFDNGQIMAELRSLGGIVTSQLYVDNNTERFSQVFKSFDEIVAMNLDATGVKDMLGNMPRMVLEPTVEKDSIAGFLCSKTIANFASDSVPAIALYHTSEIEIPNPNWWNQFNVCDEVLLGYEVEQYGMRMRLRATSVRVDDIDDSIFSVPEGYAVVDWMGMQEKIEGLLDQYKD
jgi:hypothetical protein